MTTNKTENNRGFKHYFDKVSLGLLKIEVVAMVAVVLTCGFKLVTTFVI